MSENLSNIVSKGILYQETLVKVTNLFDSSQQLIPIETADETLRLRKIDNDTVQIESAGMYVIQSEIAEENPEGILRNERTVISFKTLALYKRSGEIFVPLEIENICRRYPDFNDDFFGYRLKFFTLLENAVIAAFSMETYRRATLKRDFKYQTNDLNLDIFMNFDNEPQVWLDDKYGINHPIAIYFPDEQETINSVIQTKEAFEKLSSLDILQIFKRI
jgi:hypothetical protein